MNSRPPKLRRDLIVRTQQTSHETSVIVKDPVSRKFFRMGEVEQFIAEQLDGKTPLEAIRQRVEVRFGGELPKIGRASCRERGKDTGGGRAAEEETRRDQTQPADVWA